MLKKMVKYLSIFAIGFSIISIIGSAEMPNRIAVYNDMLIKAECPYSVGSTTANETRGTIRIPGKIVKIEKCMTNNGYFSNPVIVWYYDSYGNVYNFANGNNYTNGYTVVNNNVDYCHFCTMSK